ncbi:MAG: CocE/NonD family hydrolase [Actinobacteria bacterium]|nr:CocE/NonD family hydrolase [Actinomycetota bacterium]
MLARKRMGRMAALAAAGAVAALLVAAFPAAGAALPYGVSQPVQHAVRMSDGVRLAVDVYVPTDPRTGRPATGRFPVVMSMTPYGKRSSVTTQATGGSQYGGDGFYPWLVQHGYIDVVADVRGTGSSDGDFQLFGPREMRDGVELVRWAAGLPGSTGRVGMAGSSYVGLNQIFTAALAGRHSPLRAIVPEAAGIDLYRDLAFGGGIPNVEFAGVWDALRASMTVATPDEPGGNPTSLVTHPVERAQRLAALDAAMDTDIDTGGPRAFDGPFWQQRAPRNYLARIVHNRVATLLVSGWNDVYQRGVALDYSAMQNFAAGRGRPFGPMPANARTSPRYQAVIGAAYHNAVVVGPPLQALLLRWFDTWLKGRRPGLARERRTFHAYELDGNRWTDSAAYPFRRTRVRRFWLAGGRSGSAVSLNDGVLAPGRPAAGSDRIAWTDAASPCSNQLDQWDTGFIGYGSSLTGLPNDPCAKDDRTAQTNALTYSTAPMPRDVTVGGPIDARVVLTSTTRDAEVVATVDDVSPDGASRPLTTGALLASNRDLDGRLSWRLRGATVLPYHPYTRAASRPLTPARATALEVELYPTLARIASGHRLRLTVATAATHLHASPVQLGGLAGGVYEVQRGTRGGSWVDIPLLAPTALRTSPVTWTSCGGGC